MKAPPHRVTLARRGSDRLLRLLRCTSPPPAEDNATPGRWAKLEDIIWAIINSKISGLKELWVARARGRRPRGRPLRPAGGRFGRGASRLDALHVNTRRQSRPNASCRPTPEIGFASRRTFRRKFWRWGAPRTAVRANKKNLRAVYRSQGNAVGTDRYEKEVTCARDWPPPAAGQPAPSLPLKTFQTNPQDSPVMGKMCTFAQWER